MANKKQVLAFLKEHRDRDHTEAAIAEGVGEETQFSKVRDICEGLARERKISRDFENFSQIAAHPHIVRVWRYASPQPGWAARQIANTERNIREWPEWMRREAFCERQRRTI